MPCVWLNVSSLRSISENVGGNIGGGSNKVQGTESPVSNSVGVVIHSS